MKCNSTYEYVSNLIKTNNVSSFGQVLELQHLASVNSGNIILTVIDNNFNRFHAEVHFDFVTNQIFPPKTSHLQPTIPKTIHTAILPDKTNVPMLSGIPEVDITILNFFDDKSLAVACQLNQYTAKLCQRDELWRLRVEKYFLELFQLNIPTTKSWKDFYILISKIPQNKDLLIEQGETKILQWMMTKYGKNSIYEDDRGIWDGDSDIQIAAEKGQLDTLILLKENIEISEDFSLGVNWWYEKLVLLPNAIEILQWLYDNNLISLTDKDLFIEAMDDNRLDIMKWIYDKNLNDGETIDLWEDTDDWDRAIRHLIAKDNIETFKWLVREDLYLLDEEDTQYHAGLAAQNNSNNILNWFLKKGIMLRFGVNDIKTLNRLEQLGAKFDYELANDAAKRNNIEVLKALIQRNIFPTFDGINDAIRNNHINILDLLQNFNIPITSENMNFAAEINRINILNWGAKNNIFPNADGANRAVKSNSKDALNWMGERGIAPNQIGANYATKDDDNYFTKWMLSFGVYPDQHHVNWAARNNRLELLKILNGKNILPDSDGADWALDFRHYHILDYLAEKKIYPTSEGITKSLQKFEGYGNEKLREQVKSWLYQWNLIS